MLIEREQPLSVLLAMIEHKGIEQKGGAHGQIALIYGEAGIGKTALLATLNSKKPADVILASGECDALFTPRPLGPFHDIAEVIGSRFVDALSDGASQQELYDIFTAALKVRSSKLVLVIEDLHWADHATLDFLRYLGRRVVGLNVLLILTYRNNEVGIDHPLTQVLGDLPANVTTHIPLSGLSEAGVELLARKSGFEQDSLFQITAGNPFFVTEILNTYHVNSGAIPASIRDAIGAQLSRLDRHERKFLELMSVLPAPPSLGLLNKLMGNKVGEPASYTIEHHLLVLNKNGTVQFRHELTRLSILERLTATQKQVYHAKILAFLLAGETDGILDQVVHHAAGAFNGEAVLKYAPLAAAIATKAGAHHEATSHLSTALDYVDEANSELAATLYESWAYEAGLTSRIDDKVLEARRHAITLWRALGRLDKVGENLRWMSRLHWYRGEAAQATRFLDQAIEVLESIPPTSERAMAYSSRSQSHMLNDEMEEAIEWGEKALALEREFENIEARIHALNNIGTAQVFRCHADGLANLENSLALAVKHNFHEHAARAYTNMSGYAVEFRQFELAEATIAKGIAFDNEHDLDAWTHYLSGRLAELRLDQGRLDDAVMISTGILEMKQQTMLMKLPARLVLSRAKMRIGAQDAKAHLDQALSDTLAINEVQYLFPARLGIIEYAWLHGYGEMVQEHFDAIDQIDTSALHIWYRGRLAVWKKRCGRPLAPEDSINLPAPFLLELAGKFEECAQAWEKLGLPYEAGCARMQSSQTKDLICVVKGFQKIGAFVAADRTRELALKYGYSGKFPPKKRGPYKATRSHPLGLTRKEQEILVLLSHGQSNKEISDQLTRSQRTIEHHVSSILAKFSTVNRMALILRVQNEPWLLKSSHTVEMA